MSAESAFDQATAVQPDSPGAYTAQIHPEWSFSGYTNGGYLLALATRAALLDVADDAREPLAVTGAFVAPVPAGPARIHTEVLRRGRGTTVVRARIVAEGQVCLETLVTAGPLPARGSADDVVLHPAPPCPVMPAEETCPRAPVDNGPMQVRMLGVISERFDPATIGFAVGRPRGVGEFRAWLRFDDGRDPDPLSLVMFPDVLPPSTFDLPSVALGWVPTLQLSVFVRARPAPGALVARCVARSVGSGGVDETCDLWDSTGRHVAVSHQLAGIRRA